MVELSDREKKIVLIKYIIHGVSPYDTVSIDIREQMLIASLKTMGLDYDKSEMLDLGEAILKVQEDHQQSLIGFLKANKEQTAEAMKRMGKGNDRFKLDGF
jgi:hypothetical protein